MPRRANYGFEKRQKELKRQQKREEKAARKREKKEIGADSEPSHDLPGVDDLTSESAQPESAQPESAQPESAQPESARPESARPDTGEGKAKPDGGK